MNIKKKNALFGRYPSCDLLNRALRYLQNGDDDDAAMAIIQAIEKADGYFYDDNVQYVTSTKVRWESLHDK